MYSSNQKKDTAIQEAREAACVTEWFLRSQRSVDRYNRFHDCVLMESSDVTDEPVSVLLRKRKIPHRIDDGAPSHKYQTPRDFCRHLL